MQGDLELKDQIDTSHHFLIRPSILEDRKTRSKKSRRLRYERSKHRTTGRMIKSDIGMHVAEKLNVERQLVNAIAAVGLATLNQVGVEALKARIRRDRTGQMMSKSPDAIIAERAKRRFAGHFRISQDHRQKILRLLFRHKFRRQIPRHARRRDRTASQKDRSQDWQEQDERCWEGPVPIECTSASCGTCWVGVLGGREKLRPSPVANAVR